MDPPSLSILVASSGRSTLTRTLQSIAPQLRPGDELLVDVNADAPWGHEARNRMMPRAKSDVLCFMDDDDIYTAGAFDALRTGFAQAPDRMHMFRMRYPNGRELWETPELLGGNVSTQMVCVPNIAGKLGRWGDRYEGDWDFIRTCELGEPVFHEHVIALVRPHEIPA